MFVLAMEYLQMPNKEDYEKKKKEMAKNEVKKKKGFTAGLNFRSDMKPFEVIRLSAKRDD